LAVCGNEDIRSASNQRCLSELIRQMICLSGQHSKREPAPGLRLDAMIQSVNLSSRWEPLCYFIYPLGVERNMPPNLRNSRKRILV
jgi:hypothetical protein